MTTTMRRLLPGLLCALWLSPVSAQEFTPEQTQVLLQTPLLVQGTRQAARVGTAAWFDRQGDLRDALGRRASEGGLWSRLGGVQDERSGRLGDGHLFSLDADGAVDEVTAVSLQDRYKQDLLTLNLGADFVRRGGDSHAWLAGAMVGYVRSTMRFDAPATPGTPGAPPGTSMDWDSVGAGVYAGFIAQGFFIDLLLHHTWQQIDMNEHMLDLRGTDPEHPPLLSAEARTLTGRADIGHRLMLGSRVHVEPLLGLLWIKANIDDMVLQQSGDLPIAGGPVIAFGERDSVQASAGARLGIEQPAGDLRFIWTAGARLAREFKRDTSVEVRLFDENEGNGVSQETRRLIANDRFVKHLWEAMLAANISNAEGSATGVFGIGARGASRYRSLGFSAGFRYQW